MRIEIAFDIGGTFTDLAISADGVVQPNFVKVPTSNSQPAIAALQGLQKLCERFGVQAEEAASILHATTIAANAIMERRGANTSLITTRGFRDILLIGRHKRQQEERR